MSDLDIVNEFERRVLFLLKRDARPRLSVDFSSVTSELRLKEGFHISLTTSLEGEQRQLLVNYDRVTVLSSHNGLRNYCNLPTIREVLPMLHKYTVLEDLADV
jgi:hypothetical protein